ncbi:PD40 domain-containing protein [Novosphingobium flavum]|uniref:PD40 domain-containing protein n=1 Tax=Novosphingobium flavum TaxID=1778672 RepID=A0A7X1KNB7_9SPHN|nr:oligogalacturonate lyase family protein [Novosphingobium flavum]MBC2667185.1 PD40 domain-containing protein [Novosphingobium flavum]
MRAGTGLLALAMVAGLGVAAPGAIAAEKGAVAAAPASWIDAKTGHRVLRLSDEPGVSALYFNEEAYTPQGDRMVISSERGIISVDLKTWQQRLLVPGKELQLLFAGRKTRSVYYAVRGKAAASGPAGKDGDTRPMQIWTADIDSGKTRKIAEVSGASIASINADETLLAGVTAERSMPLQPGTPARDSRFGQANYAATGPDGKPLTFAEAKEVRLNDRLEAKIPMEIFVIDVRTGERRTVVQSTDWLNHLLFSPTDPSLLMFCHEGPWHKVDRIWTVRTDGSQLTKVHTRTMNMEIAGHEFWAPDGKTIWYDLQTPRGEVFWLASYDLASGKRRWYALDRNEWSVHYNISPDQKLFAGDGGDNEMVAHAPDGKWLYLFRPRDIPDVAGIHAPDAESLIKPGRFDGVRLVDLSKHDYRLEPNARFTPDGKWLVFRSNMEGRLGVYAVEVAGPAK